MQVVLMKEMKKAECDCKKECFSKQKTGGSRNRIQFTSTGKYYVDNNADPKTVKIHPKIVGDSMLKDNQACFT